MVGLVGCAIGFAGCLGSGESRRLKPVACLEAADTSRQPRGRPAVVALLESVDPRTGAFERQTNRLIRFSLPAGRLEAERQLGRPAALQEVDSLRLRAESGPRLVTRDRRTLLVLVKNPVSARDHVAAIDPRTLRSRCELHLEPGVRYGGLLLGRSGRLHAFGVRPAGRGRWDAVVTSVETRTGKLLGTRIVREGDQTAGTSTGRDWWPYSGALSADGRWLALSYHGGDTTGADAVRLSPGAGVASGPTDAPYAHGAVTAVGRGFVAATGGDRLLRLDRRGRVTARLPIRATKNHLMDFALGAGSRRAYLSSCGRRPAIQRLDLDRGTPETMRTGKICGKPLAVHGDRFLVLDAWRVSRLGYPMSRPAGLRVLDLQHAGRVRAVPRSVGALDAEVVEADAR